MIDKAEWEEIYVREFPRVYRALAAVLRSGDEAFDAVQDAFLEGLRRPPSHRDNLAGWLFRVGLRRARRRVRWNLFDPRRGSVLATPVDDLAASLDRMEVTRLLARLTTRQRAIVIAEYYLGLRQDEIAELFAIRRGTVAATLAQARARMRAGGTDV